MKKNKVSKEMIRESVRKHRSKPGYTEISINTNQELKAAFLKVPGKNYSEKLTSLIKVKEDPYRIETSRFKDLIEEHTRIKLALDKVQNLRLYYPNNEIYEDFRESDFFKLMEKRFGSCDYGEVLPFIRIHNNFTVQLLQEKGEENIYLMLLSCFNDVLDSKKITWCNFEDAFDAYAVYFKIKYSEGFARLYIEKFINLE